MNIEDLRDRTEGWEFEAKLARGQDGQGKVPMSLWETYSAMANTQGGFILLGARENRDRSLQFVGIPQIEKVERDLWTQAEDPKKVSVNLLRREDVNRVEIEGASLLLIHISKAARQQRPVYLNDDWQTRTYIRVGEGDKRLDEPRARRMMLDRDELQDDRLLRGFDSSDLHPQSVRRYRELLAARNASHPFLNAEGDAFLEKIGALRRDRDHGGPTLYPTHAGMWVFGREERIVERFPSWRMSYKELSSAPSGARDWVEYFSSDGSWNANLLQFYLKVIPRLYEGIKGTYTLSEAGQGGIQGQVRDALREAFVNMLIHADHHGNTGIKVIKSDAGYHFINSGLLLISEPLFWQGTHSVPRNAVTQRLFKLVGLCELEGSGGPLMRQAWRQADWRAPRVTQQFETGELSLFLPRESLFAPEDVGKLVATFGLSYTQQDELGRLVLVLAQTQSPISHADVMKMTSEHSRNVTMKIQELLRYGLLKAHGNNRAQTYTLSSPVSSPHSPPVSSPHSSVVDHVAARARVPGTLMTQAILAVCQHHHHSLLQIAQRLQRAEKTIARHVSQMLQASLLAQKYPDNPNHPDQAYIASSPHSPPVSSPHSPPVSSPHSSVVDHVAARARVPGTLMTQAILAVCQHHHHSLLQIAQRLQRAEKTIARHVSQMLQASLLARKYPDNPNHPDQAYIASSPP